MKQELADNLRVVLVAARNPLNIGAAARAMSNFGFERMRVVNCYDVAFREARSAVGAPHVLANAEEFPSVAEAVADCSLVVGTTAAENRQIEHQLQRLDASGGRIRTRMKVERVALLFGSEKRGLSNDDLSYCHWLMRIPTREAHGSMNLGQAVAVCLYELIREEIAGGERRSVGTDDTGTCYDIAGEWLYQARRRGNDRREGSTVGAKDASIGRGCRIVDGNAGEDD